MQENHPITPTTVRPLRVMGGIATGLIIGLALLVLAHDGLHHYRVWQAGGEWCAVFAPDGSFEHHYGAVACGYE